MMKEEETAGFLRLFLTGLGRASVSQVAFLLRDRGIEIGVETFAARHGFTIEDGEVTINEEAWRGPTEAERKAKADIKELARHYGASLDDVGRILEKYGIDEDVEDFLERWMHSDFSIEPKKVMPRLFDPSDQDHVDNAVASPRFITRLIGELVRALASQSERIEEIMNSHYDTRQITKEARLFETIGGDLLALKEMRHRLRERDDTVASFCVECGHLFFVERPPEVDEHMRQAHPGEYPLQSIGNRVQTTIEGGGSRDRQ